MSSFHLSVHIQTHTFLYVPCGAILSLLGIKVTGVLANESLLKVIFNGNLIQNHLNKSFFVTGL